MYYSKPFPWYTLKGGAVLVVIVWYLDLNLPIQSLPITTKSCEFESYSGKVYLIQLHVIKFVCDLQLVDGFPQVLWFPLPKNWPSRYITEILLKVALNLISHCEGKFNWKSHNTSYCLIEVVTKADLLYLQVEKLIEWTDVSLKIAALVNFLVFLQRGVYHSLLERVLGIQPVFPDKQGIRQVNYNDSSSIIFYPALVLFEQSNRIDWINFCYIHVE